MGTGTGVGVGVASDGRAPESLGAAVAVTPTEDSGEGFEVESVAESDEQAAATKRINDSNAKIGFIPVLIERARHQNRGAALPEPTLWPSNSL